MVISTETGEDPRAKTDYLDGEFSLIPPTRKAGERAPARDMEHHLDAVEEAVARSGSKLRPTCWT